MERCNLNKYKSELIGIAVMEEVMNPDYGYPVNDIGIGIKSAYSRCKNDEERDIVSEVICAITGWELSSLLKFIDERKYCVEDYCVSYEEE